MAAEGHMEDKEAQEVAPILEEIKDHPPQGGPEDLFGKSYKWRAGEAWSMCTGKSWWRM